MIYKSITNAHYSRPRYILIGEKRSDGYISYSEGYALGDKILFDSRLYAMPVEEFEMNFEGVQQHEG